MSNTRDHPVFKRLSRQQLIVRRRSLGLQPLVLDPTFASSRKTRCKHCGRRFNPVWKSYLCHLCGRWVCEPCSSVVERERELLLVRFVRCCVTCTKMLNKLPEPELLLPFLAVPYVTASSNSQLGLHLADVLRTKKDLRPTVLQLLSCLGRPLGTNAQILAEIREEEWAAATELVSSSVTLDAPIRTKSGKQRRQKRRNGDSGVKPGNPEWVQFLVQQCFEVSLTELPLDECVVSESDGTRQYPIFYDEETDVPFAPTVPNEAARDDCMAKCNLLTRGIAEQKEVQLICHLAAKEFDALLATVTAVQADKHYALSVVNSESTCVSTDRAKSFCAHSMVSGLPFLVRNTLLDVRFRTFACVRGDTEGTGTRVLFYFGFPIRAAHSDTVIAMLCVMDTKPRKSITTMQYSVMKKLTEILSSLWTE